MAAGRVLVYGGKGALGSRCVTYFKTNNYWVASIDTKPNADADLSIVVDKSTDATQQRDKIIAEINAALNDQKLDAILNVAGGWAGGNAAAKDFLPNSLLMVQQSVNSSLITAEIASKYLKLDGVVTLTGAKAALDGTPGMIGYGLAKAAVHQLTKSLAKDGGLPTDACALAILPVTLDTPMNRKWMAKADTSTWTPLEFVTELFGKWTEGKERPGSGSLVQLITAGGATKLELA